MPKVRDNPAKWSARASAAGGDFANGVASPRRSQSASAIAAKDVYAAALQQSISQGRFEKGLSKAGDAKWQKGVREKGQMRYQQGVAVAQEAYRAGFAPYKSAIESVDLGPRGPKGQNYDRVQKIGAALMAVKTGQ